MMSPFLVISKRKKKILFRPWLEPIHLGQQWLKKIVYSKGFWGVCKTWRKNSSQSLLVNTPF
jgi:hypothetical protein